MDTKKCARNVSLTAAAGVTLGAIGVKFRFHLMLMCPWSKPLREGYDEGEAAEWFDDYYTVEKIGHNTYAIGEPRYWQRNYNYLVVGKQRALLIDAGPGIRDINPVVESLTNLPYTTIFTHLHYDHIGNGQDFPEIAVIDLPHLREREKNNHIQLTKFEHFGLIEGIKPSKIRVDTWCAPGGTFDLGNRIIDIQYTPGHTPECVSLYDRNENILFSGDWFTEALGVFAPSSSMGENLSSLESTVQSFPPSVRIFPAHKYVDGGGMPQPLSHQDLVDSRDATRLFQQRKLRGKGVFPRAYSVNNRVTLYTDIPFLMNWKIRYPEIISRDALKS